MVLLAAVAALAAEAPRADVRPLAVVSAPTFTFEPVWDGEVVEHDFIIQNRGTADLEIQKVNTG
jgi:hypothetical protein